MIRYVFLGLIVSLPFLFTACSSGAAETTTPDAAVTAPRYPHLGEVIRFDERLDEIISPNAQPERLAAGFDWSEGPVWINDADGGYLLFSDVPRNHVLRWVEGDTVATVYLEPSGYTGTNFRSRESGSNGLLVTPDGSLLLCQHGNHSLALMNAPLDSPITNFTALVDNYNGKRLNSPNDAVVHPNGDIYFTDPPYGLPGQADSELKELDFQGVYRYAFTDSTLLLLTAELSRPNGIVFTPDGKNLIVANSDPNHPVWVIYPMLSDGTLGEGRIFFTTTNLPTEFQTGGLPDGMQMHLSGYLFATGPEGVLVFHPDGSLLGIIRTTRATSNCATDTDQSFLYITADDLLLRIPLRKTESPTNRNG